MRVEQFRMIPASEGHMGWLAPGRLRGNRFSIVIRRSCLALDPESGRREDATNNSAHAAAALAAALAAADATIRNAVKSVQEFGFINYVGLQRFAKGGVRSDIVGLACLRCDYPGPQFTCFRQYKSANTCYLLQLA
jgi:tRNA(Glu) U13 pseudouridine synthase TruD